MFSPGKIAFVLFPSLRVKSSIYVKDKDISWALVDKVSTERREEEEQVPEADVPMTHALRVLRQEGGRL